MLLNFRTEQSAFIFILELLFIPLLSHVPHKYEKSIAANTGLKVPECNAALLAGETRLGSASIRYKNKADPFDRTLHMIA